MAASSFTFEGKTYNFTMDTIYALQNAQQIMGLLGDLVAIGIFLCLPHATLSIIGYFLGRSLYRIYKVGHIKESLTIVKNTFTHMFK